MNSMNMKQSGFTLIELVMVIVILGILAVVAMPKFLDLKGDAAQGAVKGVAGALGAASALNKAARLITTSNGISVVDCTSLGPALDGGLPTGYTITAGAVANGATASCTLTGEQTKTATFTAHGIT